MGLTSPQYAEMYAYPTIGYAAVPESLMVLDDSFPTTDGTFSVTSSNNQVVVLEWGPNGPNTHAAPGATSAIMVSHLNITANAQAAAGVKQVVRNRILLYLFPDGGVLSDYASPAPVPCGELPLAGAFGTQITKKFDPEENPLIIPAGWSLWVGQTGIVTTSHSSGIGNLVNVIAHGNTAKGTET